MKLYKEQCTIDARHRFFCNRIVDIWNCLPASVVLSPSVAVFIRNLATLTLSSFLRFYVFIAYAFITGLAPLHVMYYCGVSARLALLLLIHRAKLPHKVYGHDTTAILWV